jgi:hypothetical protein
MAVANMPAGLVRTIYGAIVIANGWVLSIHVLHHA